MEENRKLDPIIPIPAPPAGPDFTARGREFGFAGAMLLLGVLTCNFVLYGGFHLGFALGYSALTLATWWYLHGTGYRFDWYSRALLVISLVIAAGFGRSNDGFVKFVLFAFLMTAVNLSFCLATRQNRRSPGGAASLKDAPRALFVLGWGNMGNAARGVVQGVKTGGTATRKMGSVAAGVVIAVPIMAVMIALLMDADAAFEGLMSLLPRIDMGQLLISAFFGVLLGWSLYSRGLSLVRTGRQEKAAGRVIGVNSLTVNTVLTAVCLVYCVYLVSQLAYLSGGFSGILPQDYTMAAYARRGFFEMAWLCALNLAVICGSVALQKREGGLNLHTRLCGSFLGAVTLFLVATASAKMFMYIGSYGLTRLRVLTEVIMLWLAITTVLICLWLHLPKLPYMKVVLLSALIIGAAVMWVDVDTQVAKYNVRSYQSGAMRWVDVEYLSGLNLGAVPYLQELTQDDDPNIAARANRALTDMARYSGHRDWRRWNLSWEQAREILEDYEEEPDSSSKDANR